VGGSLSAASGVALWLAATAGLSAGLTWLAIHYARRRQLLDLPGQRRSHTRPTPRGGGIAIVVAMLVSGIAHALMFASLQYLQWLLPPVAAIALVGWLDDHGGLSARMRFATHCAAAAWVFALPLLLAATSSEGGVDGFGLALFVALAVTVAIVWSINLHNFMDGINGLLTLQTIFVLCAMAGLFAWCGIRNIAPLLIGAAACSGFVPFNFPRARVFMGDVGSGVLGFVIAVTVLWQIGVPSPASLSGVVLCSAFVTDATCTLLSRFVRGRRWYSAHREHLYQWLARSGFSHAQVVAFYMGWNLVIVLPAVCWMNRSPDARAAGGIASATLVYVLAVVAWWFGKRWCLKSAATRSGHAAA
jgi:UDP-N-acetylmuramyl pentapeptide phosphotransferase/UDP-N-acetylglucosamine-1-phosphate transferase